MPWGEAGTVCCCPAGYSCGGQPPKEQCRAKVCGPDIADELTETLSRVKSAFASWGSQARYTTCLSLVTLPAGAISWDISELGPGGRERFADKFPDCATCGYSVQVGRDCHYAGSVNYVAYGLMMRLCRDHLSKEDSSIADWFTQEEMLEMIYIHKNLNTHLKQGANFAASNEWALVGYRAGSIRPTPQGDRNDCKGRCSEPYSGPGFTVRWLPKVIRPKVTQPASSVLVLAIALSLPVIAGAAIRQESPGTPCIGQHATIVGTTGDDRLNGTARDDVIDGGAGNDRIDGRGGDDVICGGDGNDQLGGGGGSDLIDGGGGDDSLTGGADIDVVDGGSGDDTISGGPGRDAANYGNAPTAVSVDLGRQRATGWGTDRLTSMETALGSRFGDNLVGDGGRNRLHGLQGNDRLIGLGGGDLLDGGPGPDFADGGLPEATSALG